MLYLSTTKREESLLDALTRIDTEYVEVSVEDFTQKEKSFFMESQPYGFTIWGTKINVLNDPNKKFYKNAKVYDIYFARRNGKTTLILKAYGRVR